MRSMLQLWRRLQPPSRESLEDLLGLDARARARPPRGRSAGFGRPEPELPRMLTIVAFIVALGLLIAVHEYGHYRVAVACGVKVLRFSVGFGKTLYRWQPKRRSPGQDTEFVIGAFPLGGYVKMLDEREGAGRPRGTAPGFQHPAAEVPRRHRRGRAGRQPAAGRAAVRRRELVSACRSPRPILASPVAGSRGRAGRACGRRAGRRRPASTATSCSPCARSRTCAGC